MCYKIIKFNTPEALLNGKKKYINYSLYIDYYTLITFALYYYVYNKDIFIYMFIYSIFFFQIFIYFYLFIYTCIYISLYLYLQ